MSETEWRCERFAELDRLIALENARDLRTVAHHAISDDTEGVSMPATSTDATQVKWERHKGTIDAVMAVVAEHFNTRPEQLVQRCYRPDVAQPRYDCDVPDQATNRGIPDRDWSSIRIRRQA